MSDESAKLQGQAQRARQLAAQTDDEPTRSALLGTAAGLEAELEVLTDLSSSANACPNPADSNGK